MLRAILGILLVLFVGALAFYAGRTTAPPSVAVTPAPEAPDGVQPQQGAAATPSEGAAAGEQSRGRAEAVVPSVDAPPSLSPNAELKGPALPNSIEGQVPGDAAPLYARGLGLPLVNLKPADIHDTFSQARGGGERRHEASDIMAAKGTPVVAVDTGIVAKLFTSKPGGLTIYQFDPSQKYAYYYAHLDGYAPGLKEGMLVKKGDRIGFVGVTGNSDPNAPHLHFAIFELGPEKHWWEGKPINPYPILMRAVGK
jgi:murein DD-endopeptidase MepM/ murein hydrolase activator NlpD